MWEFIGAARRYFYSTTEHKYYLSEGYFYLCNIIKQVGEPTEDDHFLKWIEAIKAIDNLYHEPKSWAINEVLSQLNLFYPSIHKPSRKIVEYFFYNKNGFYKNKMNDI